jgi:hypothetical protein
MGILGDAPRPQGPEQVTASAPEARSPATPKPPDDARSELRRRRDALAEQVTEMHWDLGGLAYEMAIRDHFRLDVLVRRAGQLQERDAELAEVERLLRLEDEGAAGTCPSCGAPHSRGAVYCWQCGLELMERAPGPTEADHDGATAVMDALLTQASHAEPPAGGDAAD